MTPQPPPAPSEQPASRRMPAFLAGGGQMGELIASHDWQATPLGPIDQWSTTLRVTVSTLLRAALPMASLWGEQGILVYNEAYAQVSGARHPGLLGMPVRQAWPEASEFNDRVVRTGLAGRSLSFKDQEFVLDRQGRPEPAFMNLDYSPVVDDEGQPVGVIAVVVETTDKVLLQRRLQSEREQLGHLFEQAPGFMALLRGPEHRFELANPSYMRVIGHRPILGRTLAEALPDAVAQGYLALLDQVYATGVAYSAYGARYDYELEPGGATVQRDVDFVFQPIRDAMGQVSGIFIEGTDVTERMSVSRQRDALALFTDRLRGLDDAGDIAYAASEILGRALGASRVGFGTFDDADETLTVLRDWRSDGVETVAGVLHMRQYGSFIDDLMQDRVVSIADVLLDPRTSVAAEAITERQVRSLVNAPIMEHGRLVAIFFVNCRRPREWTAEEIAFVREISARTRTAAERVQSEAALRASEARLREANETLEMKVVQRTRELMEVEAKFRQSQKMEAIGQLTGGIAHDFNNLLGGMSTSLQILERRLGAQKFDNAGRYIGMAQDSVRRAAALTHRLLAFSRRQTLDPRPTDVNRLVAGIEEMVRRTVGPAVVVEVVGAGGLWLTRVDASQLENALLNLCINARDAMTPQGGRLTIETANKWLDDRAAAERELPPGQYISVCVTDTGTGMSSEIAARAFDPFFTTKPMGQGTGLGLSMVYGFVRQSGGQVRIYSEAGSGTTMCLYLPRFVGESPDEPSVEAATIEHRADGEMVLVVEDEVTIRALIEEELVEAGYQVIAVGDGPSALRVLQAEGRIDLLLTDVGLPGGLNGRQVADAGRVGRPDLRVLFITGYAENAAVGNGLLDFGMEVVTKPFDVAALVRKVQEMIERT